MAYLDETGFEREAARTHGYAPKGQRVYGWRTGNRRPRTSCIAARVNGRFIAPFLFDGTTNAEVFNLWLKHQLAPRLEPGTTVIMDNAAFHKHPDTEAIIKRAGCDLLYLPPYSPDLNPTEHDFANLKNRRRLYPDTPLDTLVASYQCLCD